MPDVSALTQLRVLRLMDLKLAGAFPRLFAGVQTALVEVRLRGSAISGTLPALDYLPNLRILDLRKCALRGTLPSFAALPQLEILRLDSNQFEGFRRRSCAILIAIRA